MATEWQLDDVNAWPQIGEFFAGAPLGAAHHLEVRDQVDLDEELAGWVAAAYDAAS